VLPVASIRKIFIGLLKNISGFLFAFKVLLKQNRPHLVCYGAIFLLWYDSVRHIVSDELLCFITRHFIYLFIYGASAFST